MRIAPRPAGGGRDPGLKMTAMIDIVFLLLVFFLLTFKIVAPEGDLSVKMPATAAAPTHQSADLPPEVHVRLVATDSGELAAIQFGRRTLGRDFHALRDAVRALTPDPVSAPRTDLPQVRLDCDPALRYEYTMEAVTAVSGYRHGGRVIPLIAGIQLGPPR